MGTKKRELWDVLIVGAGASGLMAAITAARSNKRVVLLEKQKKIGKKLLATGNGKCNFTNEALASDFLDYYNGDLKLVEEMLSQFSLSDCLAFFREIGVYPKARGGYYYPNSNQAASVLLMLEKECTRLGVCIRTECEITDLTKKDDYFVCKTSEQVYKSVTCIIATGLLASPKLGSDGSFFPFVKQFGHHFEPILPALTGFYAKGMHFKLVSGVRCEAKLRLYVEEELQKEERGELQLADYGVSGIPVFQISSIAGRALYEKKACCLHIDFLPDMTNEEVFEELKTRQERFGEKETAFALLCGLLPDKLIWDCLHKAGLEEKQPIFVMKDQDLQKLITVVKNNRIRLEKERDAEFAQVCSGGIRSEEIDIQTLESKLVQGLFFAGEILNADGICGGYNLHFAWASGYVAGKNA